MPYVRSGTFGWQRLSSPGSTIHYVIPDFPTWTADGGAIHVRVQEECGPDNPQAPQPAPSVTSGPG